MAAYTKGTQLAGAGFDNEAWKKRQMSTIESNMAKQGFTQKSTLPSGQTQFTKPAGSNTAIGSSFGRMIGGGGGGGMGMAGLKNASMRLADAAAKRDREKMQFESGLEEKSKAKDVQISLAQNKIAEIKNEISAWEASPPSINKQAEIRKRREALQSAENELNSLLKA